MSSPQAGVLVVDDSFFMRKVICDILQTNPRLAVVGQAADGEEALQKIAALHPDIMTLDLVMPRLDGLGVLRRLQQEEYAPVTIMVSAHTGTAALATLDCLEAGAIDFVLKPSETDAWQMEHTAADLLIKLDAATAVRSHPQVKTTQSSPTPLLPAALQGSRPCDAVVIGASTGGPMALEQLLPQLPAALACPVLVAQHMPAGFIEALAARLTSKCKVPVKIARDGEPVRPGSVYVCPGGATTEVIAYSGGVFRVRRSSAVLTPSIDELMISAVSCYGGSIVGVILTGMGEDGVRGAVAVRQKGGTVIVQDEASSAVFGMGKAVVEHGAADVVLPLGEIVPRLLPKLAHT